MTTMLLMVVSIAMICLVFPWPALMGGRCVRDEDLFSKSKAQEGS